MKGQGSLEYLLLIGGAILVAVIVIALIVGLGGTGQQETEKSLLDGLCAKYGSSDVFCNAKSVSFKGSNYQCSWNDTVKRCEALSGSGVAAGYYIVTFRANTSTSVICPGMTEAVVSARVDGTQAGSTASMPISPIDDSTTEYTIQIPKTSVTPGAHNLTMTFADDMFVPGLCDKNIKMYSVQASQTNSATNPWESYVGATNTWTSWTNGTGVRCSWSNCVRSQGLTFS